MRGLSGRVAIVTGAASRAGIGFATARRLHDEGVRLVMTDIDGAAVAHRASDIAGGGADVIGLRHDVTSEAAWTDVVEATLTAHGRIDILINNAGMVVRGGLDDVTIESWRRQFEVNVDGVFLGCKAVVARLKRQDDGGAIVNISSIAGLRGIKGAPAYSSSKGAVTMLTKSLALELAAAGIRVNSVHPGIIRTEMHGSEQSHLRALDDSASVIPLRRVGTAEEVAAMAVFLASADAAYVTGAQFVVDGGLIAQSRP